MNEYNDTEKRVFSAADALYAETGKMPTVHAVRKECGVDMNTTCELVREWKERKKRELNHEKIFQLSQAKVFNENVAELANEITHQRAKLEGFILGLRAGGVRSGSTLDVRDRTQELTDLLLMHDAIIASEFSRFADAKKTLDVFFEISRGCRAALSNAYMAVMTAD